jgi:hypothetical protein
MLGQDSEIRLLACLSLDLCFYGNAMHCHADLHSRA